MWELINAKAAAQRTVFDKEALYKSVEEVISEAVSAQMEVEQEAPEVGACSEPLKQAPSSKLKDASRRSADDVRSVPEARPSAEARWRTEQGGGAERADQRHGRLRTVDRGSGQ
ncbi:MAG: hypothetical protein ACOC7Y_01600 [Chloroflexota bacterium]